MNKNTSFLSQLFRDHLLWWILGIIFTMLNIYFLGYIAGRIYPSKIDDMGHALVQQLRVELIILAILIVVTPTIINTIEVFYSDSAQNRQIREHSLFRFSFDLTIIKRPALYVVAKTLIILEITFIASLMIYLKENYYNALNNSMDFLVGAPYLTITVASSLLLIDCALIFCILLFTFLWGYSLVQWISERVSPAFQNTKYYSPIFLLISLIFRILNVLGLASIINFLATFSGEFETVVKFINKITLLLFFWVGIYIMPYLRERVTLRKNRFIAHRTRTRE